MASMNRETKPPDRPTILWRSREVGEKVCWKCIGIYLYCLSWTWNSSGWRWWGWHLNVDLSCVSRYILYLGAYTSLWKSWQGASDTRTLFFAHYTLKLFEICYSRHRGRNFFKTYVLFQGSLNCAVFGVDERWFQIIGGLFCPSLTLFVLDTGEHIVELYEVFWDVTSSDFFYDK